MQRAPLKTTALFAFHKLGVSYRERGKIQLVLLVYIENTGVLTCSIVPMKYKCDTIKRKMRRSGRRS